MQKRKVIQKKAQHKKKTRIEYTKKSNKNMLNKNNEHQRSKDASYPWPKKDTPAVDKCKKKTCIDCNQMYNEDYTSKADTRCIMCNAGKHGCLSEAVYASKGSVWMCGECMKGLQKENTKKSEALKEKEKEKERNKAHSGKDVEKKTESENLLEYQGANITAKDIKTLENGQWVCDEIISLFLAFMREDQKMKDAKILLVNPSTTYLLQESTDKNIVNDIKQDLRINEKEWVFYPINNNKKSDNVGGTHWSLLLFCRRENVYYHYDPIEGMNKDHARKLILNTLDLNNFKLGGLPEHRQAKCPKQENSYDCGPYIMLYIREIVNSIIVRKETIMQDFNGNEATKFRKQM